jgi:hypothetical protein
MPSRRAKKQAEVVRLFADRLRELRRSRGMTQTAFFSPARKMASSLAAARSCIPGRTCW